MCKCTGNTAHSIQKNEENVLNLILLHRKWWKMKVVHKKKAVSVKWMNRCQTSNVFLRIRAAKAVHLKWKQNQKNEEGNRKLPYKIAGWTAKMTQLMISSSVIKHVKLPVSTATTRRCSAINPTKSHCWSNDMYWRGYNTPKITLTKCA